MAIQTKSGTKTSPKEVIERAKSEGVEVVDVRFIDLPHPCRRLTLPTRKLEVDSFTDGLGFDGSSIRGFQPVDGGLVVLMVGPVAAVTDPVLTHKTLFLI